ncbi:MAG TPA: head-tail adaptor [Morganella sp. (in: Bacteria)]|nr:head-tail adaptor [Morganella sp. (in: enterobacteria)]
MPLLDVSDILSDPDFADTSLVCRRNKQDRDDDGFSSNSPGSHSGEDIRFSGVVTVDRSLEARRMEAGQTIGGAILIVTCFRLTQGNEDYDADVVTYQGRRYRVTFVDPYTAYGAGFVQAHCELVDFNGGQPVE